MTMEMPTLNQVIEVLVRIIDLIGIGVIFWGIAVGVVGIASAHLPRSKGTDRPQALNRIRCRVGSYTLLGLEILIASDIAKTVIEPSFETIILLGGIVAIRTVLSFFLTRELEALPVRS
jgi:uncharacterized membrane protein